MRKKMIFILNVVLLLAGCTKNNETANYVDSINKNNGAIYLYMDENIDEHGVNNIETIASVSNLGLTHEFSLIVIDVSTYNTFLTNTEVCELYNLLGGSHKVMVMFWKAENYNFFKDTPFANEKDYYDNTSLLNVYYNFNPNSSGIKDFMYDSNIQDLNICLSVFNEYIIMYKGAL